MAHNLPAGIDRRKFLQGAFATGALVASGTALCGCSNQASPSDAVSKESSGKPVSLDLNTNAKEASKTTLQANESVYALLDFSDERERGFAARNLIAAPEALEITNDAGDVIWSQKAYEFLEEAQDDPTQAPNTANPSLWRNAQINHLYGLFEVTEGIYQVRGYDMTNITFIAGETGWIVFDPLMSVECSRAAMNLVADNLGERPVVGIVISHPHPDHFGGIKGVISEEEVAQRNVPIIVPQGFVQHAVSENVYAGNAMGRRASYQYGVLLEASPTGKLSIGIGMDQSSGAMSYIPPNDTITQTGETRTVDGVLMEFHMTPGTEASAEMNTWFPNKRALWLAENCTSTLHNLYTLRGAEVRDGNAWANYLMEALARYGSEVEVTFQSHNWPHWDNAFIREYLINTAAMYKFITDQTLMYLNQGYTQNEIAHMIELPPALEKNWYTRQYYGTVAHNAKAVYQKYMGFYDANPVHLAALPPAESAVKLVEYLGSTDAVLQKAQADFDAGNYQWVAEITNVLVFANPKNKQARYLCADALEQLGYQAESGAWRNAYLSGAKELREGTNKDPHYQAKGIADIRKAMTPPMMLDYLGVLIDANAAQDVNLTINLNFIDEDPFVLTMRAGVVLYEQGAQAEKADATLTMPRTGLFAILSNDEDAQKESIQIEGDSSVVKKLTKYLTPSNPFFNIVEP